MRISFHRYRVYTCCMCIIITILFKNLNSRINCLIFISNKTRKHNLGCRSYYSRSRTIWNLFTKLMIFSPWLSNTVNIGKNIYRHVACFSIRPFQARVASEKGGGGCKLKLKVLSPPPHWFSICPNLDFLELFKAKSQVRHSKCNDGRNYIGRNISIYFREAVFPITTYGIKKQIRAWLIITKSRDYSLN